METIKLKTISVKDLQTKGEIVRERSDDKPLLLKVGEMLPAKQSTTTSKCIGKRQ
jgi:hypothetical protein